MKQSGLAEEIKNRLEILEVVSDYVPLKKAGQNWKGRCPFHNEKTPSFMVNPAKQIFHCFGCGAGGDLITFVMKQESLTFPEALKLLAGKAGIDYSAYQSSSREDSSEKERFIGIQKLAVEFFRECLVKSAVASEYLKSKRGLKPETIEAFLLGYAPDGWHGLGDFMKTKSVSEADLVRIGLLREGTKGPYDYFRARVMFPIFGPQSEPIAFGGRVMDKSEPKYLNSPDTPLFRKGETLYALNFAKDLIRQKNYSIITEGYLDAIVCHEHGFKNAVAPLGTALTEGHIAKLKRYSGNIVLVFDGDRAGIEAAKRSLGIIASGGMRAKVLIMPDGEDPDSLLRAKGPEHFQKLLASARTMVDFILKVSKTGRAETVREALETISKVGDKILREDLVNELADRARMSETVLRAEMNKPSRPAPEKSETKKAGFSYNEEALLLSAALNFPERAGEILGRIDLSGIQDGRIREIFRAVSEKGPAAVAAAAQGGEETGEEAAALIRTLIMNPGFDPESLDRNIEDCLGKLASRPLDAEISEAHGDLERLNKLIAKRRDKKKLPEE